MDYPQVLKATKDFISNTEGYGPKDHALADSLIGAIETELSRLRKISARRSFSHIPGINPSSCKTVPR